MILESCSWKSAKSAIYAFLMEDMEKIVVLVYKLITIINMNMIKILIPYLTLVIMNVNMVKM